MKNTTLAIKMYKCALNYYDACEKLKSDFTNDNVTSIFYPLLYLERHTLELSLKSAILFSAKSQDITDGLKLEFNTHEIFDLSRTHSLLILIDKYIEINKASVLFPKFDENIIYDIRSKLVKFNAFDSKGDFYRYPITKDNKQSKWKIYDKLDEKCLVNINKSIYICRNHESEKFYILKNLDLKSLNYFSFLHHTNSYFLEQLYLICSK